jgi:hypothetical protein
VQDGKPVEMENFFSRFGLDIIGKAVFGYEFDSLTHDDPVIQVSQTMDRRTLVWCVTVGVACFSCWESCSQVHLWMQQAHASTFACVREAADSNSKSFFLSDGYPRAFWSCEASKSANQTRRCQGV